ncbi:MAG: stage III sporulation protein AG [Lachnospiraceae bacterium]|nr:stage III sporulation protein AG [Lachnospiraceae bacterium]
MIDKCRDFFKNKNNLIVVVLVGILLMVIALPVKKRENGVENRTNTENTEETEINNTRYLTDEEDYVERMERRLEEALSRLDGAGEVKVMITLRASSEVVVEKDATDSLSETREEDGEGGSRLVRVEDTEEATVYISESGRSSPYVVKTLTPQVEGVIVLAEGAGEGNVSMEILDAVRVIFGIEAHRIKVMKLNGTNS